MQLRFCVLKCFNRDCRGALKEGIKLTELGIKSGSCDKDSIAFSQGKAHVDSGFCSRYIIDKDEVLGSSG